MNIIEMKWILEVILIASHVCRFYLFTLDNNNNYVVGQINELKKIQNAGGRSIYTWQKQPTDIYVTGFGVTLAAYGIIQLVQGHYRLATGKGKMD